MMMMMRRVMILFVLVCVMSLTMAHPQQSLSPTQSLRRDVRSGVKGWLKVSAESAIEGVATDFATANAQLA